MRWLLPLILFLGACAGEAADASTTSVALGPPSTVISTTSTTTAVTTTPAGVVGPVDMCRGRAQLWEPGVEYVAECFAVPVTFDVSEAGWRARAAEEDWVFVSWVDPEDRDSRMNLAVTALPARGAVEERLKSILETEGISLLAELAPQRVAGVESIVVDVEGDRRSGATLTLGGRECSTAGNFVLQGRDEEGYFIASGPVDGDFYGVGACQVVRVWVLGVGDYTVTIIGGTADPTRHEEAVARVESLFEGMSFDVGEGS